MPGLWNLKKIVPAATAGAVAFTLTPDLAYGFFPPVPLGSTPVSVSPPPTAPDNVPPPTVPPVAPPTVPPPPFTPPVSPPPPVFVPPSPPPHDHVPQPTPEPATVVSGLIGLAVLGGAARRRQKPAG